MNLSMANMERAGAFIHSAARPLEQALFAYYFHAGTPEEVYAQLAHFQNPDGGFGRALEPDLRLPASSVYVTTIGLQILRDLATPAAHPLTHGAIRYLLQTFDAERQRWPIIPPAASEAPHAPWWSYGDDLPARFGEYLANPRAEILGYLYDYAELVPHALIQELTEAIISHLASQPDAMEMHDLLCYLRLLETRSLPEAVRTPLLRKLQVVVDRTVAREPADWEHYGLQPLSVISSPTSPLAPLLGEAIDRNLDYLIAHQGADGAWGPSWTWGDLFPETWPAAEREWKGVITVSTLRKLQTFGRLETIMRTGDEALK